MPVPKAPPPDAPQTHAPQTHAPQTHAPQTHTPLTGLPLLDRRGLLARGGLGLGTLGLGTLGLGTLGLGTLGMGEARAAAPPIPPATAANTPPNPTQANPTKANPAPPARALAFVMNSGSASVAIIDMATHKVLANAPTLREPSHWALTPDHAELLICDASGNALFSFDPRTGKPLGHRVLADPYQISFSPDGKLFVVNALRLNFVDIYDARELRLARRLRVGAMPSHVTFSPDSRWSFNSMQQSGTVVAIDLASQAPRWTTAVGPTAAGVLWLDGKVLCCVMGSHDVVVLDPANGKIVRRVATGVGPHNLFLAPDRTTLYVTNRAGGTIAALDAASLRIKRVYNMGFSGPDDMGIAPDGKLWVALRFREQVAVLDPASGHYETIDVGRSPHGIFLNTALSQPGFVTAEIL